MRARQASPLLTRALVGVAAAAALGATGCLIRPVRPQVPRPVVTPGRVTLPPITPGQAPLILDGAWVTQGGRSCVNGGLIRIITAAGAIPLDDAHLCVTDAPLSIDGEATVGVPALGVLAGAGVHAERGHARVRLAIGRDLGQLDLGGHQVHAAPDHYYLFFDLARGLAVTIGNATLTGPGGSETIVVDGQGQLVYIAGQLRAPGLSIDGAFGFSLGGRLGLRPAVALHDGRGPVATDATGQVLVAGSMPLADLPITVSGDLLLDVDANRDGRTVFDGDLRDLRVLGNGAVSLGYDKKGFGLALKVADCAVWFDGATGTVAAAGQGGDVFAGTPLAALSPHRSHFDAHYHGSDDFALHLSYQGQVLGQPTREVSLDLDPSGVHARMRIQLPAGMGAALVTGDILSSGSFALHGIADLTVARLRLAGAQVGFTPRGISIDGRVNFLGTGFAVHGGVQGRHVSLRGSVALNLVVFRGEVALSLGDRGVTALARGRVCVGKACIPLAGMEIDGRGRVCPIFPVIGKQCIRILGRRRS